MGHQHPSLKTNLRVTNQLFFQRKRANLFLQKSFRSQHIVKDVFANVTVDSTERIVQEIHVGIVVHSPSQTNSLLLTSGQVDSLFTNLGLVASGQHLNVRLQSAGINNPVVIDSIQAFAESDVVLQGGILDPGLLRYVSKRSLGINLFEYIPYTAMEYIFTLVLTLPVTLSISPRKADMRDDFPAPTVPTTATKLPCLHLMLIDFKMGLSSGPHEKVPFSMTMGSAEKKTNSKKNHRRVSLQ